ncbi:MAG: hypothetical protein HY313_08135 [Acidobacteria bacterium]|nr:hypothetical protein [Acidobacteriota bacterium]
MANESEDRYSKYLSLERDALNRLYYAFWIMFVGGLVYSFHIPTTQYPHLVFYLVLAFRVLAVVGTGINFIMQYHAIASVGHIQVFNFLKGQQGKELEAAKRAIQAEKSDRIVSCCEIPLQLVAGAFLLTSLVLSFLLYGPNYD